MTFSRRLLAGAAVGLLHAAPAAAQEKAFYLDRLQLSGAPDDGYATFRPSLPDETRFFGSLTLGHALNPLRKESLTHDSVLLRRIDDPVANQLIAYPAIGAEVAGRAGVQAVLPFGVFMDGKNPAEEAGADAPNAPLSTAALHDLRLDGRLRLWSSRDRTAHIGVGAALWLPTGDASSFAGDDRISTMPYVSGELDVGPVLVAGMLGVHLRPAREVTDSDLAVASELRWALGGFAPLRDGRLRVGVELWGTTGVEDALGRDAVLEARNTDLEWLAQGRYALDGKRRAWLSSGFGTRLATGYGAPDLRVLAGIGYSFPLKDREPRVKPVSHAIPDVPDHESDRDGDGYPDGADSCPDDAEDRREPSPDDGCPLDSDRDHDGIPDAADRCPDVPEDHDGVADEDGCPETDADDDQIPDSEDRCPESAGFMHPEPEKYGCREKIVPRGPSLFLLEPIQFEFNRATIKPVSFPILDEVVGYMRSNPEIRIAVHGHTDSQGSDDYNLRLSQARARAVMLYLTGRGIAAARLESEGFGEGKPVDTNETAEGRAKNRRVEFILLGRDG